MKNSTLETVEKTFRSKFERKVRAKIEEKFLSKVKAKIPARFGGTRGRYAPPVTTVGVALIGVGNIARWAYLPRIREEQGFRLVGVFDVNKEAAEEVARDFSGRAYESISALLSDDAVEAVLICSPPRFHQEAATAALEAGKHVLCEKPLASSYEAGCAMWEVARTSNMRHMVNFSYRYRADVSHFIDIVRSGMLGSVYHVTGMFSQGQWFSEDSAPSHERGDDAPWRYQVGGGVVFELGSHLIDILRQCFGEVARVNAWAEAFSTAAPDCENACGMSLRFSQGPIAHVVTSRFATGYKEHSFLEVAGSRGCLRIEEGALRLWTRDEPRWRELLLPVPPDQSFLSAFHGAIQDHSKLVPGFWDGFKNNEVIEAIYRSAETGNAIDLPLDSPPA